MGGKADQVLGHIKCACSLHKDSTFFSVIWSIDTLRSAPYTVGDQKEIT